MRRQDEYARRMAEASRELPPDTGKAMQTDTAWGGFRGPDEPQPPTTDEWIASMQRAMYADQTDAQLGSRRALDYD